MSAERRRAVEAASEEYDVEGVVPGAGALPAGSSLLVSGAPMTGKTELALSILAAGVERGEHALVVGPDDGADRIRDRFPPTDRLHVVDCSGSGVSFEDTDRVKYVSSPGDLTGIGIGIAKSTQSIGEEASAGLRLAVLSLSTILRYTNLDALFNFVHVLTGRIEAAGYLGVFTIDPTVHDARVLNTITAQVDGTVELRVTDGGDREVRVAGVGDAAGQWSSL